MRKDRPTEVAPTSINRSPAVQNERRTSSRLENNHNGSVQLGNFSYIVEIADVSESGAQLRVRHGLVPSAGQTVTLQFLNGTVVQAHVVWSRGTTVSIRFQDSIDASDIAHFDELGADYFSAVLRYQLAANT
jgi:hypothetical protein